MAMLHPQMSFCQLSPMFGLIWMMKISMVIGIMRYESLRLVHVFYCAQLINRIEIMFDSPERCSVMTMMKRLDVS
jgi:hypothetical protein